MLDDARARDAERRRRRRDAERSNEVDVETRAAVGERRLGPLDDQATPAWMPRPPSAASTCSIVPMRTAPLGSSTVVERTVPTTRKLGDARVDPARAEDRRSVVPLEAHRAAGSGVQPGPLDTPAHASSRFRRASDEISHPITSPAPPHAKYIQFGGGGTRSATPCAFAIVASSTGCHFATSPLP